MTEFAKAVAAQGVDLRDDAEHGIADALGLGAQFFHIDLVDVAGGDDLVGRFLRDDAEPGLHAGQSGLDIQIFPGSVLVRPDRLHGVGAEDVAEDGGIDDGGWHHWASWLLDEICAFDDGLRPAEHRSIHHASVDLCRADARCYGGNDTARPVQFLGTRRESGPYDRDLAGVNA